MKKIILITFLQIIIIQSIEQNNNLIIEKEEKENNNSLFIKIDIPGTKALIKGTKTYKNTPPAEKKDKQKKKDTNKPEGLATQSVQNKKLLIGIEKLLELDSISAESLILSAKKYIGTRHRMGGTSIKGIDCSGLLFASFRDINIAIPRSSQAISVYGNKILNKDSLKRGDLIFFTKTYRTNKTITHSGIYLGEGKFIHTSSSYGVGIINLNESKYWLSHYVFGTRIFN